MMTPSAKAIVIGASAGALEALYQILPGLPKDYPLPIMTVVHVPADKPNVLPQLMTAKCNLPAKEAEDKEMIESGTIYFSPPDYHLLVEENKSLSLSVDEPVFYSRPAIDVLFESAAEAYGPDLIGIVLTGANSDGAQGLKAIVAHGGVGLVQDPVTAYAAAMPTAALEASPTAAKLSLEAIADYLRKAGAA